MRANIFLGAIFITLIFPIVSKAQVVINEFSASNLQYWSNGAQGCEDFIELYNNSGAAVNIGGYWLSDRLTNPMKWQIPAGFTIPAYGYRVFVASGRLTTFWDGNYYHTTFKFTQGDQEHVVFSNPAGTIIDSYWMEKPTQVNHSRARTVNGTGVWGISTTPTPAASNANVSTDYLQKPVLSLQAGFYTGAQTVTITNTEPNSVVRYTTNGTWPTATSTLYTGPITVNPLPSGAVTIKAKTFPVGSTPPPTGPFCNQAQATAGFPSNVPCQTAVCAADPFCCNNQWDGICAGSTATIPACATCQSTYSPPVVGGTFLPSFTETNTYFINLTHTVRTVSLSGQLQQWNVAGSGGGWVTVNGVWYNYYGVTFEYFDENGQFQFEYEGELRRHGNDSWAYAQRGMRFHTHDELGTGNTIDYPLFTAKDRQKYDVVIMKAAGSDCYQGTGGLPRAHLRDGFAQTAAQRANLATDCRTYEHQVSYLNGQYWGVYEMRERVDSDYTDYYYNQNENQVDILKFWGGLEIENGTNAGWNALYNFITTNSMANQTNYDYVATQLDPEAFIDNFVLNTFLVNSDWLNWNTMWWRGNNPVNPVRWRYAQWDLDNIVGLGQNYTGWSSTGINANTVCEAQNMFQGSGASNGHTAIYAKLLENEGFFMQYLNRYADLLNTGLHCDTLVALLDEFEANMLPEMPRQVQRWGGTVPNWQLRVNNMKTWVCARWNIVMGQIVDCFEDEYNISGPYDITIVINGPGSVQLNTITIQVGPWTGTYFGGLDLGLLAQPDANAEFVNWEIGNYIGQDLFDYNLWTNLNQNDTIVANFEMINPLPVEWLSFTGEVKQNDGHLYWSTATEMNSSHFEIQRTSDGRSFVTIGQVTASGNSAVQSNYQFVDASKPEGKQYYRLKQVDFNGEYDYSFPVLLDFGLTLSALLIAPNPSDGIFNLMNRTGEVIIADLYNPQGKLIQNITIQPNESVNVNLSNESAGVYLVRHIMNDAVYAIKVAVY
jgi:hypothetical protein